MFKGCTVWELSLFLQPICLEHAGSLVCKQRLEVCTYFNQTWVLLVLFPFVVKVKLLTFLGALINLLKVQMGEGAYDNENNFVFKFPVIKCSFNILPLLMCGVLFLQEDYIALADIHNVQEVLACFSNQFLCPWPAIFANNYFFKGFKTVLWIIVRIMSLSSDNDSCLQCKCFPCYHVYPRFNRYVKLELKEVRWIKPEKGMKERKCMCIICMHVYVICALSRNNMVWS